MQQTTKYKLDLIEKTDAFSPDALNQNMEKVEGALAGEEAARKQKDAYLEGRADGLDQRVTALEVHKIAVGTYTGDGKASQFVPLGFTPALVFVQYIPSLSSMAVTGHFIGNIEIAEGGFTVLYPGSMNKSDTTYSFVAFF